VGARLPRPLHRHRHVLRPRRPGAHLADGARPVRAQRPAGRLLPQGLLEARERADCLQAVWREVGGDVGGAGGERVGDDWGGAARLSRAFRHGGAWMRCLVPLEQSARGRYRSGDLGFIDLFAWLVFCEFFFFFAAWEWTAFHG